MFDYRVGYSCKNSDYMDYVLKCIKDDSILIKFGASAIRWGRDNQRIIFPRYKCPKCDELYTFLELPRFKFGEKLKYGDHYYTNICRIDYNDIDENGLLLKSVNKPYKGYVGGHPVQKVCKLCNSNLGTRYLKFLTKKGKQASYTVKFCDNCKLYYINVSLYKCHKNDWKLINPEDVSKCAREIQLKKSKNQLDKNNSNLVRDYLEQQRKYERQKEKTSTVTQAERQRQLELQHQRHLEAVRLEIKNTKIDRTSFIPKTQKKRNTFMQDI